MQRPGFLLLAGVILLAGALFVLDTLVPLGVAVWLPYVGVVLLSLWFPERWQAYSTAAVCTALMFLGHFLSPPGGELWRDALNRALGIVALWIAAVVGLAARRTRQLAEANRRLQQEIVERERLQAQLLRTQRLESIGVLASGIAHDFNNLLTPILMAVKILREDRPKDEREQLLTTLQASAERGGEMVRQLLAFAGGCDGQRVTVSPGRVIHEIKTILEHTVPRNIQVRVAVAGDVEAVRADPTQMAQVLLNLCINARDAMPDGGSLRIEADSTRVDADTVRTYPDARPGPHVRIRVADSGVGIQAEVLDKVFDPFFTTKGAGKGSGLGLSIALGIVHAHGGFITVSSVVGTGSEFTVYLPAAVDEGRSVAPEGPRPPVGRGELILVVDDEPFIRRTVRSTLEGHGYGVVTAADGLEALEVYRRRQSEIRAVLLDMMMPAMDGQATLAALEDLDAQVGLIASSGLRAVGRVAEAVAAGRAVFLGKPYTADQLLAAVAEALQKDEKKR